MNKQVIFESLVTPDVSGYGDKVAVIDEKGFILFHSAASCCPNPTKPGTILRWTACYGWVAPGQYQFKCIDHPKHGKCLSINNEEEIPTRVPNVNHNLRLVANGVLVHRGDSEMWRGSAACLTLPPSEWDLFIACFELGDTGPLTIIDYSKTKEVSNA